MASQVGSIAPRQTHPQISEVSLNLSLKTSVLVNFVVFFSLISLSNLAYEMLIFVVFGGEKLCLVA